MEKIRVLIADDEEVFRKGLAELLASQPHIEIVSECGSGKETIRRAVEAGPDVILMNSQISEHDLLEAVKAIRASSPDIKVAVIGRPGTGPEPLQVLKAGARAYLAKSISSADLVKSIELISSGRIIISPVFAQKFLDEIVQPETQEGPERSEAREVLSEREMDIVRLIAEGNTNKEIAARLFIAENTVKVHVKSILNKLELRNRQQVAAYAVVQNWVSDPTARAEQDGSEP